jgi:hypothetical protein
MQKNSSVTLTPLSIKNTTKGILMKKTLISIATLVPLLAISATSHAMESCPAIAKIEQVSPGVYRAAGEAGEWTGILQGVLTEKPPVQSFNLAIAIQQDANTPQTLQYCSYNIGRRDVLDMRFISKNGKDFTIKTGSAHWKKEDGPFGLIYNVCETTAPENCTFTINR